MFLTLFQNEMCPEEIVAILDGRCYSLHEFTERPGFDREEYLYVLGNTKQMKEKCRLFIVGGTNDQSQQGFHPLKESLRKRGIPCLIIKQIEYMLSQTTIPHHSNLVPVSLYCCSVEDDEKLG